MDSRKEDIESSSSISQGLQLIFNILLANFHTNYECRSDEAINNGAMSHSESVTKFICDEGFLEGRKSLYKWVKAKVRFS